MSVDDCFDEVSDLICSYLTAFETTDFCVIIVNA